ncbi:MAG: MBL fold metallo-hydrolase [Burkholderiales bacterium]|nr:MBL fold metallo-hydrolase [Burkholderiales bacterium]
MLRRRLSALALATAATALVGTCASTYVNPYYDPAKPHHTPVGFKNNYPHPPKGNFWKWRYEQWRDGLPRPPANGYVFPVAAPQTAYLRANRSEATVTWIGHATLLVQVGGLNILTDPHFGERASPVSFAGPKRLAPLPIRLEDLPRIDLVVISHNHYDHLDEGTVVRLAAQPGGPPLFVVPLGMKPWLADVGVQNVAELDWWESRQVGGAEVHLVPAQHWSARTPWDDNRMLWGGFVILHPELRFFYSGDTGYSRDFEDIGRRFGGFDLAAIPIGAYEPRWFMGPQHVNPEEAVRIHRDVRARRSVGVHWGTFELTDEPLDEPPAKLAEARARAGLAPEDFFVMHHGETRRVAAGAAR